MATDSATVGRPKKSPVWDYFHYDQATGKSTCEIVTSKETNAVCGRAIAGKFSTNLKLHLKAMHIDIYRDVLKKEKDIKEKGKRKEVS